jgi:hypothetical protein
MITVQVMTFPKMSAENHYAISPLSEGIYHKFGMDHAGTHDPNDPYIVRILHPRSSGKVCRGIGAPVAAEGNNFRFKIHLFNSISL